MYVVRSPERDRIADALRDASAARRTTRPRSTSSRSMSTSRGACPRPSAPRARRSPFRSGRGSRRRSRSRSWPRSARRSALERTYEAREPPSPVAGRRRRGLPHARLVPAFRVASTRAFPPGTTSSSASTLRGGRRHQADRLHPLRPLPPLVALRIPQRHVAGSPTPSASPRSRPSSPCTSGIPFRAGACRAGSSRSIGCSRWPRRRHASWREP